MVDVRTIKMSVGNVYVWLGTQERTVKSIYVCIRDIYTVQPVLRGHLWDKEKVVCFDRWPF